MNKTKKSSLILFLIFIIFFSNVVLAQDNSVQIKKSIQQLLDTKLEELELYGIQAAVRIGDIYWQGESGFADSNRETELKQNHSLVAEKNAFATLGFSAGAVASTASDLRT